MVVDILNSANQMDLELNDQLREHIQINLQQLELLSIASTDSRHAAVALTLVDRRIDAHIGNIPFNPGDSGKGALILTIRSEQLKDHGGQRAFPGGRIDAGETAEQAALRELEEEVGLHLDESRVLGRLDDYATRSGFVITPVVIWGGLVADLCANPAEVASIHRIPLSELLRSDAPILEQKKGREHPVLKMPLGNDWIAAPTAALAYQFSEVALMGRHTRVAHFDQPRFAWS
jgi:8-oxo-dGTP pyrophosphatase MutT (NUDIX family)